jgi:hypothetical protein
MELNWVCNFLKELQIPLLLIFLLSVVILAPVCAQESSQGGGSIRGMVYGLDVYDDLVPLHWAKITVEKEGVIYATIYTSEGYFEAFVPGGTLNITIEHDGYLTEVSEIYISPGSSTAINFYLDRSEEPIPEFPTYTIQILMAIVISAALLLTMRLKKRTLQKHNQ